MKQILETIIKNAENDGIRFSDKVKHLTMLGAEGVQSNAFYTQPEPHDGKLKHELIVFNPYLVNIDYGDVRFIKTFFHELGHSTGRHTRLNRTGVSINFLDLANKRPLLSMPEYGKARHIEEIIAERIAQKALEYFKPKFDAEVCRESKEYIQHHAQWARASAKELNKAEKDAEDGFQYILQNYVLGNQNQKAA